MMPTRIVIEFIAAKDQRYKTVGDWQVAADGTLTVRVTQFRDDAHFCVAVHELIEAWLCLRAGITAEIVDYADSRPLAKGYEEHGDMPVSEYHAQHDFASCIERMLAHEMGVNWTAYSRGLDAAYNAAPDRKAIPDKKITGERGQ